MVHTMLLESILFFSLVGTRRSVLRAWGTGNEKLGWIVEKQQMDGEKLQVSVGWGSSNNNDVVEVLLPSSNSDKQGGGLASSLWPAGLAGSVLLKSPGLQSILREKRVLELGSGLGLAGLVVAADSSRISKCVLTDKDDEIVETLRKTIEWNHQDGDDNVVARLLEWRDEHNIRIQEQADVVIGTDVAYYHYLLGPLLDTAQSYLTRGKDGLLYIVGPANRETQWDLYHNLKDGGYNQKTDKHDPPWPGKTAMLLYNLQVGSWTTKTTEEIDYEDNVEQEVPIAALLYARNQDKFDSIVRGYDHVATREDEEGQMMTF